MRKWLPLIAVCLGAFMLLVDVTIVTVALPDMATSLHTTFADLQWVMDVYALALAALLLGAGSLADQIGRRKVYLAGLVLFAAASLACGLATGPAALIAFRGLQGVGGAAMFATTMALLSGAYQGRDRGIAFGVWGAVNGAAAAAGPILGGLLTEHLDWRWIFYVNLPVSVLAVVVTLRVVKESRNPEARGVDLPGLVTFTLSAGALTYALIRVGDNGWTSTTTLGLLALSAVSLLAFLLVQRSSSRPMLDLALFRSPAFVGIMIGGLLLSVAAFSYLVYTSLWLQSVLGLGPVAAGLALLPMSIVAFLVAGLAGRLLHGAPPRFTIGGGLLLIGAGALLQATLDAGSTWTALVLGLAVTGAGVGLATPAMASSAMAAVPQARAGMAGGALNTARQLGNALGIALLGAVFQAGLLDSLRTARTLPDPLRTADALTGGQAGAVIAQAAPEQRPAVGHLVHVAFASGLQDTFLVSGALGLAGGAAVLLLVRRPVAPARPPVTAPVGSAVAG
ncbi:MFS transporter [Kitasatospora atroaurantiaca]|uniref:EmrB/QacA subfamily drug resistance transporter n=1 Tax=Kitasatospora atroaurantiaca TaxID=285545 RepID=A0A561F1E4_9ACTN|nr:MFS transporter [Kitasatospora atroaurantiaca]TWE21676.1 EmrB/QacA subfamily drug resistance transporter [Kitasatospora atroaurantiaca]